MIERLIVRFIEACPFRTSWGAFWSPLGILAAIIACCLLANALWYKSVKGFFLLLGTVLFILREEMFIVDIGVACRQRSTCRFCVKKTANEKLHSFSGPSVICKTGKLEYRIWGTLHRYDGPAYIDNETGVRNYYLHGWLMSEEQFDELTLGRTPVEISSELISQLCRLPNVPSTHAEHAIRYIAEVLGEPNVAKNLAAAQRII